MTGGRSRWLPWTVLVAALGLLVASIAWVLAPGGVGRVDDLAEARVAAAGYADRWGLDVGEVMEFDNGFYAELVEPSGALATEVLVNGNGSVRREFGPAMMWNTAYGMRRAGSAADATVEPEQARALADAWLARNRPGESADEAEQFPGYYTLHTLSDGEVVGMMSVHARTGAVWHHSWHGDFVAMAEPEGVE